MATSSRTPDYGRKAGMWSTITAAVQAGWGPTGRLLTVLGLLGALLIGVAAAAGNSGIVVMLGTLLAGSR